MKSLLLSLLVLASIMSCGKDNKVSSTGPVVNYSNPILASNPTANTYASELVAKINTPASFGNGQANSYSGNYLGTWNTLIAGYPSITFQYSNGNISNSSINITNKQNELVALVNKATNVQFNGIIYYVTVQGVTYAIDPRYALQMNPIATQFSSGYYVQQIQFLRAL
jgi:hypothetical protein